LLYFLYLTIGENKMSIKIQISGVTGSGKLTLLHILGKCLEDSGLNVKCNDDIGEIKPEGFIVDPKVFDSRLIDITTRLE